MQSDQWIRHPFKMSGCNTSRQFFLLKTGVHYKKRIKFHSTIRHCLYVTQLPGSAKNLISQSDSVILSLVLKEVTSPVNQQNYHVWYFLSTDWLKEIHTFTCTVKIFPVLGTRHLGLKILSLRVLAPISLWLCRHIWDLSAHLWANFSYLG